jgi:hypothetical protein
MIFANRRKMIILRKYGSLLLVSVLAFFMAQAGAQSPTSPLPAGAPTKFDVASIRPSADRSGQSDTWMGIRINGGT